MSHSHKQVQTFEDWCSPKIVANAEELLANELARMKKKPDSVHLCLSTDPFMYGVHEVTEKSLKLIKVINSYGITCSLLTKGIYPVDLADQERFPADNILGISLISLNEDFRKRWEPGASPYRDRIGALRVLHDLGCKTLVHIEPYPTPNIIDQDMREILEEVKFADRIFFSGWNYKPQIKEFAGYREFYHEMSGMISDFCALNNIQCEVQ